MSRVFSFAVLVAATLACGWSGALRAAAPDVTLDGPEITKLDWNIRALTPADLDGDGRTDLAIINNDHAAIELLYQHKPGATPDPAKPGRANRWEPVLEDARFRRVSVTTGITMIDLTVADLNGDGRPDLIYTGDTQALTIRYQQADGTWLEKKISEAPAAARSVGTLHVADLDGDGRPDLVMLGLRELAIFRQQTDGTLAAPERFALADENCYGLEVCDVNGDGLPDLVYLASGNRDTLRVRLQNAAHQFGPELALAIKPARSTLQTLPAAGGKGAATFVFAANPTGQLEFFTFEQTDEKKSGPVPRPRVFTPPAAVKNASYAFGDFNGDGREDVAMSDPDGAQVFVYFRQADGGFTSPRKFPSLADIRGLAAADWEGSGRASLFIASAKEQVLG
ncbi:MAG: VCBS repeat-containing protein, partial [Verrucomicrobiota bacterium]